MAKHGLPSGIATGDDIWNISSGFVNFKILKPMIEIDDLEKVALFGNSNIDDFVLDTMKPIRRKEALFRIKDTLKSIIENVSFVMRKSDREEFELLRKDLQDVEKVLSGTYYVRVNDVTHINELVINESFFNICLNELRRIKEKLNIPINRANLIFRQTDEINLDDIIRDIQESG